jgi:hypothetical protein
MRRSRGPPWPLARAAICGRWLLLCKFSVDEVANLGVVNA